MLIKNDLLFNPLFSFFFNFHEQALMRNFILIFQVSYQAYNFLSTVTKKNINENQNYLISINSQNVLKICRCI